MANGQQSTELDDQRIERFRRFNRFYTRQLGLMSEGMLGSNLNLTEARLLGELHRQKNPSPGALADGLHLNRGYITRLLQRLKRRGLVKTKSDPKDGRRRLLMLTPRGRRAFKRLDQASKDQVGSVLADLSGDQQEDLMSAVNKVEGLLRESGDSQRSSEAVILRSHRAGDLGWIVQFQASLYSREYGFDATFEAALAEVAATFLRTFQPTREHCWIAERSGARLGSVMLVERSKTIAQLRLLAVDPSARGLGLGTQLIRQCTEFASLVGYRRIRLKTQSNLISARKLYRREGYRLLPEEPQGVFGQNATAEWWELDLRATRRD